MEYYSAGDEQVKHVVVQENKCELTDLAMDTVYSFSAKVLTNLSSKNIEMVFVNPDSDNCW